MIGKICEEIGVAPEELIIKQLQQENNAQTERIAYLERSCERKDDTIRAERDENIELSDKIDKAINKLDEFIECCKCEKLESGSDYLHHQYWNMFENFNRQIKEILKDSDVDE